MKLGIIGCGNMGCALIAGLSRENAYEIRVYDIDALKVKEAVGRWSVKPAESTEELAGGSQVLIIAVKPHDIEKALADIRKSFDSPGKILISIAAGIKVSVMRKHLKKALIARAMPNTPALVGEGVSGVYFDGPFTEAQIKSVLDIFHSIGIAEIVKKEELLDAITGLSGSGPAYVFAFINALADAGVLEGLPRDVARRLAVYTVSGSAAMAAESVEAGIHMGELKDRVTSPGGTTAAGLLALENGAFNATVINAVRAAAARSREMGEK
ncbi:MAG: pyrroline-5-carboxylate reductase [Brevinematales bacterium]|jgi:pyrroline-5-carboxylate reductase